MTKHSPPDVKMTTVRLPRDLDQRVSTTAADDHRSFNAQVIVLLGEALDARQHRKATKR